MIHGDECKYSCVQFEPPTLKLNYILPLNAWCQYKMLSHI